MRGYGLWVIFLPPLRQTAGAKLPTGKEMVEEGEWEDDWTRMGQEGKVEEVRG